MTGFLSVTPFRIVRRLALAEQGGSSVYLLIVEAADLGPLRDELKAEVEVQIGVELRLVTVADLQSRKWEDVFESDATEPVVLITLDSWVPTLIKALDRNVVLLTNAGTVLLLASKQVAGHLLIAAPNLRNRLTDVLAIGDPLV